MQDRQPGKPGQYKATLTAEEFQKMQAGQQFTITMIRDDQPIVEGTPYSKAAVLPDSVASAICPEIGNPTPANAFEALHKNKAPNGFGLGGASKKIGSMDELNAAIDNGWYRLINATDGFTIGGWTAKDWWMQVSRYGSTYLVQRLFPLSAHRTELIRWCTNSVWHEEWVNPPMMSNTEYRTTARRTGKPVYVKRIVKEYTSDLGSGTGETMLNIVHKTSFDELVDITAIARCSDGSEVPFQVSKVTSGQTGAFSVTIKNDVWEAPKLKIDIAYTKAE